MSRTLHADACVVGAGAGGAVLAAELAEGGMRVVVLEQGPEHDPDHFTARPPQMLARLYRDGGQTLTLGNPPIALPLGRGLGGASGQLGRNLSLHPATAAFARMEHVVDMSRGVPQSFYVDEFAREGIMFEGVAGPPAYVAMSLPFTGRRHAEVMASYRHLAQFGLMVSDSSRGRVHVVGGRPVIRYDMNREDLQKVRAGLAALEKLLQAAGAREVFLPLPAGLRPERARLRDLRLMAFHPLGTARADARSMHGVVDGRLELHGIRGVYVADGSAVPSALGVNPQLTIMALATRLAFNLLDEGTPEAGGGPALGALAG